jgi:hypothetical protein
MGLDSRVFEAVLASSHTKQSWAPLSSSSGENPEVLLLTCMSLQSPRGHTRMLVLSPPSDLIATGDSESEMGKMRKDAAYTLFDDPSLGHEFPIGSCIGWCSKLSSKLKRRFDQETSAVCVQEAEILVRLNNRPRVSCFE